MINTHMRVPIHFDLETQDPDDVMTLAMLATHPRADLLGVTVTPGGLDQVALVKHVLSLLGRQDVLIGAGLPKKLHVPHVSKFHYKWLGTPNPVTESIPASQVMSEVLSRNPDTVVLTGAPLTNVANFFLETPPNAPCFKHWVGQGGFCGDSVVPEEHRLPKFAGKETCPTFNFAGNPLAAETLLKDSRLQTRLLIGKNVCHGVLWDAQFHQRVTQCSDLAHGMILVREGMRKYLSRNPHKALHDLLAACALLYPSVVQVRRVEPYRAPNGEWGSRLVEDGRTMAAVAHDPELFFQVLTSERRSENAPLEKIARG